MQPQLPKKLLKNYNRLIITKKTNYIMPEPRRRHKIVVEEFEFNRRKHRVEQFAPISRPSKDDLALLHLNAIRIFKERPILLGLAAKELGVWCNFFGRPYLAAMAPEKRNGYIRTLARAVHQDPKPFFSAFFRGDRKTTLEQIEKLADVIAMAPTEFLAGLGQDYKKFPRALDRNQYDFYEMLKTKLEKNGYTNALLLYQLTGVNPNRDGQVAPGQIKKIE